MNKDLAKQRKKLNREFWFFYIIGLLALLGAVTAIGFTLVNKDPNTIFYVCGCALLFILVRYPINEACGKLQYIDRQLSNKLSVIFPILDEFLHRNRPRTLYVSKNLFKHLGTAPKDHQDIYQWYNRHRGRLYHTALVVDYNLTNLQFSEVQSEKTYNKFDDLMEL